MPQGLPKKIEVGLLLPDLALELGNPPPRRLSLSLQRATQRRSIQRTASRPAWPTQRFQPTAPRYLLPFVYPPPIDPNSRCHIRHRLPSRHPAHRRPLDLCRYVQSSLHQFLSSRETVRSFFVSVLGSTPALAGAGISDLSEIPASES